MGFHVPTGQAACPAGPIYSERPQMQLISSRIENRIDLKQICVAAISSKLNCHTRLEQSKCRLMGASAQKGREPVASAMFANAKEFQIMQMHRHFARSSLLNGEGT